MWTDALGQTYGGQTKDVEMRWLSHWTKDADSSDRRFHRECIVVVYPSVFRVPTGSDAGLVSDKIVDLHGGSVDLDDPTTSSNCSRMLDAIDR